MEENYEQFGIGVSSQRIIDNEIHSVTRETQEMGEDIWITTIESIMMEKVEESNTSTDNEDMKTLMTRTAMKQSLH